jgi:NAD(P)H-quinone oxidoreductase subunit 4L
MTITLEHYLVVSAILFCIGIYGVFTRRNVIAILISLELMLNAVNINLVAFNCFLSPGGVDGQMFVIFVITVAAAEAVVGLALVLAIYRNLGSLYAEKINLMKW